MRKETKIVLTQHMVLTFSVTNTKIELLTYLKSTTGIGLIGPVARNCRQKPTFRWTLRVGEMEDFLTPLLPYLVIKRQHADLLLEFMSYHKWAGPFHPISDNTLMMRRIIFSELAEINKRGI